MDNEKYLKYGLELDKIVEHEEDGSIDYNGDVNLQSMCLTEIPFKFRVVNGIFDVSNNNLTDLTGSPIEAISFICNNNKLTSLEHSPSIVHTGFSCANNKITSLEGCPKSVGRDFICNNNKLKSLYGIPQQDLEFLDCSYNQIETLQYIPKTISQHLDCSHNLIFTLEHGVERVGTFLINDNCLYSLRGCPSMIGYLAYEYLMYKQNVKKQLYNYIFDCSNNYITHLNIGPKDIYGDFACGGNSQHFEPEYIKTYINVKGKYATTSNQKRKFSVNNRG